MNEECQSQLSMENVKIVQYQKISKIAKIEKLLIIILRILDKVQLGAIMPVYK